MSEHLKTLEAARKRLVEQRREIAPILAKPFERPKTDEMRIKFVEVQSAIEAVDRAIADERMIDERDRAQG